jgi:hypothetical protein
MTGGGDLDEIEDEDSDVMDDDDGDLDVPDLELDENDPDPTAGASDVGGVPGGVEPETDETTGPTGS